MNDISEGGNIRNVSKAAWFWRKESYGEATEYLSEIEQFLHGVIKGET